MADIVDAEVVRFVNEQIRPLCEDVRVIKARILAMHVARTSGGIGAKCPGNDSPLADGREAEGVSRLNGFQVGGAHDVLKAVADAVNDAYVDPPCVRPLEAK